MSRHYILLIVVGVLLLGCGSEDSPVVPTQPQPSLHDLVESNCLAVETAAYRFALDNENYFPANLAHVNNAGNILVDYLPGGAMLINPYTGETTEPHDRDATPYDQKNGWIEYSAWDANGDGLTEAFTILGYTDIEVEPSQPQIVFCIASEESGICGP